MSLLEDEIAEQPEVIARLIDTEAVAIRRIIADLPRFSYVVIAARGSSDHAANYAAYAWSAIAGYPIALATPSIYTLYGTPPRLNDALVVGISQSGESPDILAVIEEGRRQGRPTLAITNNPHSPLATGADATIVLHAGQERSVAATKTYTAQMTVIALLAAAWSGDPERMNQVLTVPETVGETLRRTGNLSGIAGELQQSEYWTVLGRGYNYATALEIGLKLKELTSTQVSAYSSADFRHGPIATVTPGAPIILVMPDGEVFADMYDLALDLRERGAQLLVVSNRPDALELADTPLSIPPACDEWVSPIHAVVPGQLLALHLSLARGVDPDQPFGLSKVTRTL